MVTTGGVVAGRASDIAAKTSFKRVIDFAVAEFGGLHGLFEVAADWWAGTNGPDSNVLSVPADVWQHTIDVTLTAHMYGLRHAMLTWSTRGAAPS